uniref:Secreted RxLR effector peptide protein n=1 Tax=Macrostomum lignano TaxID=282301 RepID=A0A1I8FP05_9PLAT
MPISSTMKSTAPVCHPRLLVWVAFAALVAATASAAAPPPAASADLPFEVADAAGAAFEKRQIQPPAKPDRFTTVEQFDTYMKQLEAYLKLIGRQRFGKRSVWHRYSRLRRNPWWVLGDSSSSADYLG